MEAVVMKEVLDDVLRTDPLAKEAADVGKSGE